MMRDGCGTDFKHELFLELKLALVKWMAWRLIE